MIFSRLIQWVIEHKDFNARFAKPLGVILLLNILFGVAFYYAEAGRESPPTLEDSIWWAMVTMTTVGYGDFFATTFIGRFVVSFGCFLVGIGVIGYFVGTIAETLLEYKSKKRRGLMDIKDEKHIIICNCPTEEKVLQVIHELRGIPDYEKRDIVLITNKFEELPEAFVKEGVHFVFGEPTREDVLLKANVKGCEGVFVLAPCPNEPSSDSLTFATGAIIEMISAEADIPIKVVVELVSKRNEKMMGRAKTDGMVTTDGMTDCLLVQEYISPGIQEVVHQILSNLVGSQFYISDTRLQGFQVSEVQVAVLEHPATLQVIGVVKAGKAILNPPKALKIEASDKLIVLADNLTDFQAIEEDILKNKSA